MDEVNKMSAQRLLGDFRRAREEERLPGTSLFDDGDERLLDLVDYVVGKTRASDEQMARDSSREGVVLQRLAEALRTDVTLLVEIGPVRLETGAIVFELIRGRKHATFARGSVLDGLELVLYHAEGMRDG
jgi:hypothetical protein